VGKRDDRVTAFLFEDAERRGMCLTTLTAAEHNLLRRHVARGRVVQPLPGLFARAGYWSGLDPRARHLHELRALSEAHPEWTFCHVSAAVAHGLAVSYRQMGRVHVATSSASHSEGSRCVARHVVDGEGPVVVGGLRVTSLERTVFDCIRSLPFREALAVADSAVARGLATRASLEGYAEAHPHVWGIRQARRVASLADGRAENGGESIARATMVELGFALPELQAEFRDPVGGNAYRVDFLWSLPGGQQVAGELDGREKYVNPSMTGGRTPVEVLTAERRRESRLTACGVKVLRFSLPEVLDHPYFARLLEAYGIPRRRARRP
jgi:hypothetical protein